MDGSRATALGTGFRSLPVFRAGAIARLAALVSLHLELDLGAPHSLFEPDGQLVANAGAAARAPLRSTEAPENAAETEEVAEDIGEVGEDLGVEGPSAAQTGLTEAVRSAPGAPGRRAPSRPLPRA